MNAPEVSNDVPKPDTSATMAPAAGWLEQDELLKELWKDNETPASIAEKLGRSVAAIMTRAARLGLPRRSAPGRKPGYQRKQSEKNKRLIARATADSLLTNTAGKTGDATPETGLKQARICLMCLNRFPSEGRHNRICPNCKTSAEYNAGSSIPDIFKVDT
jgi:hypothetical protein